MEVSKFAVLEYWHNALSRQRSQNAECLQDVRVCYISKHSAIVCPN